MIKHQIIKFQSPPSTRTATNYAEFIIMPRKVSIPAVHADGDHRPPNPPDRVPRVSIPAVHADGDKDIPLDVIKQWLFQSPPSTRTATRFAASL